MNNARKTINVFLSAAIATALGDPWKLYTGDEEDPVMQPPGVAVKWLDGDMQGQQSESRMRLVQIEVFTAKQDTSGAEDACAAILDAFGLRKAGAPNARFVTPKLDFSSDPAGVPIGTPLSLMRYAGTGFRRLDPPQQQARLYVATFHVDYFPG